MNNQTEIETKSRKLFERMCAMYPGVPIHAEPNAYNNLITIDMPISDYVFSCRRLLEEFDYVGVINCIMAISDYP